MTAWLALWTEGERSREGEVYDDVLGRHYSWDSTVPHHATVAAGDPIVLRNSTTLLGASVLTQIESEPGEKELSRCPRCSDTEVNPRKTMLPQFRCARCKLEFDEPRRETRQVTKYRGTYEANWVDLSGLLTSRELRNLCEHPNALNSFLRLNWDAFQECVTRQGTRLPLSVVSTTVRAIAGGHSTAVQRVRKGQATFRKQLLETYGENCAFTGANPAAVLEAAHLYSYADNAEHHGEGGFLLRRDVHRLFDLGQIAINPETLRLDVDDSLHDYPTYKSLHDEPLTIEGLSRKTREWLSAHWAMHRQQ